MSGLDFDIEELAEWPLRHQVWLILLFVVVMQCLGYVWYLTPKLQQIRALERQQQAVTVAMKKSLGDVANLSQIEAQYQQAVEDERHLSLPLSASIDLTRVLANVTQLGAEHSLTIIRLESKPQHAERYFTRLPINIELSGYYFNITAFMRAIANLPTVIIIDDIHWQRSRAESRLLTLRIRAHLYQLLAEQKDES